MHDRQSRLSTCDDVSPLLLSRRLFPRSLNESSRVIVQTIPREIRGNSFDRWKKLDDGFAIKRMIRIFFASKENLFGFS